jgi:hypothetical protein
MRDITEPGGAGEETLRLQRTARSSSAEQSTTGGGRVPLSRTTTWKEQAQGAGRNPRASLGRASTGSPPARAGAGQDRARAGSPPRASLGRVSIGSPPARAGAGQDRARAGSPTTLQRQGGSRVQSKL